MPKFALDCEMVGSGSKSLVGRVSIVDEHGRVVLDKYVKPTAAVTDYRYFVSGIKKSHLNNGSDFNLVRNEVAGILKGNILIGHSLKMDLVALGLSHPEGKQRDLAKYEPLVSRNFYTYICSLS